MLPRNLFLLCLLFPAAGFAQVVSDTTMVLGTSEVTAYFGKRALFRTPSSVGMLGPQQLHQHHEQSFVPALNSLPGVRMEERSPGSYRLSVRGSLLRSPFGIRNIRMYIDDFMLTDAGGNTYITLLDVANVNRVEVLKGPDASIYGANTGGVVLFSLMSNAADSGIGAASISAGSYGLVHERIQVKKTSGVYRLHAGQSFIRSDGYRVNSHTQRFTSHVMQHWNYRPAAQFKFLLLYSDVAYRTPGGLTEVQFRENARAARYATATLQGAQQQKAGVYNKTVLTGLAHEYYIIPRLRHVVALTGMITDFRNPFITNYETRNENSAGLRTYIDVTSRRGGSYMWSWQTGLEAQYATSRISNYGNRSGVKDTLQTSDDLEAKPYFYFTRFSVDLSQRVIIEGAVSLNFYTYGYRTRYPLSSNFNHVSTELQLMPRAALSWLIAKNLTWRVSASRGYSAPTLAEIRSSGQVINTTLQPEAGWCYETGFRGKAGSLSADITLFDFRLDDAIVRRQLENGNEYFVNAGGTIQQGMELQFTYTVLKPGAVRFIQYFTLSNSTAWYRFMFRGYRDALNNYHGNKLTGTPDFTNVLGVNVDWNRGLFTFIQYNYTGRIPLNDANTVFARSYHLLQSKAGWRRSFRKFVLEIFSGCDNILDQRYSLGNDLNAAGGRYYNAAPGINFYAGTKVSF